MREPPEIAADVGESTLVTPFEPAKKPVQKTTEVAAPVVGKDIREVVVEGGSDH